MRAETIKALMRARIHWFHYDTHKHVPDCDVNCANKRPAQQESSHCFLLHWPWYNQSNGPMTRNHRVLPCQKHTHTLSQHTRQFKSRSTNPKFLRCFIFLLPFLSPGYGMLCESLMSRRCHSSQLFMAKFQWVCTLAGRRKRGSGAAEAGTEWTAPGRVSGSHCKRCLKGKVKAAAKLLSRCSIWQNSSVYLASLSPCCFSAQVRRGHGRVHCQRTSQ